MRPEIQNPSAPSIAPHRRFFPIGRTATEQTGLRAGEPETCRRNTRSLLANLAHLGLLVAVCRVYAVEGRALQIILLVALVAMPVHYFLHYRWKKPFLLAASLAAIVLVFGPWIGGIVLGLSACLIAISLAPVSWPVRAGTLAVVTIGLGVARNWTTSLGIPESVWPVLASMFMFRMILFLYELKHARKPEPLIDVLGYFFLLPNACFLLFPVVDYRTLQRGYFARDVHTIQRRGLQMIFQGTMHLLLYRLFYFKGLTNPDSVLGAWSLIAFLFCNYLLYLHVSGQFHVACGMLHLFGYELPDTHHRYLLATGFTDYWRRINIYWKDFMVRVVFNPVAFRLKRWPRPAMLAIATTAVFVATWLLHAYQSFWLTGSWNFSVPDAVFWGVLGALVLVNVQLDACRPRASRNEPRTGRQLGLRAIKTAAMLVIVTLLWSLWTSASVSSWCAMLRRGLRV